MLVLPHHGGVQSSTQAFIEAVNADVLIRSSHDQLDRTYNGLPNIIGDRQLYNTADHGAIRVDIDASGVTTTPYLKPALKHCLIAPDQAARKAVK